MSEGADFTRYKVLSAGVLSLILLMGIARFAYTPLLPIMQAQAGLGIGEGGWLASINYLGYLCGAIIASKIIRIEVKDRLYRIGLIVALLTTVGMGLTQNIWLWLILRFFAGLSSAAGLLLGSALILNWLIRHDYRSELGIHFSGAGLGIGLCAIVVELIGQQFNWNEQWFIFAGIGVVLLVPSWLWLPPPDTSTRTQSGEDMVDQPPGQKFLRLFLAAYFCAGVGYVVSATFIVAIVDQTQGLAGRGSLAFMVMGLTAAPACIAWDFIARKIGHINALTWAFFLQIPGILLPLIDTSITTVLFSAALFGATFIGIVSLVLTMAGQYYPTRPAKMMGTMTISYGLAQILAPAITGLLAVKSGGYNDGLYIAAVMMMIGTLIMLKLRLLERGRLQAIAK